MKKLLITFVIVLSLFATYFNFSASVVNAEDRKLEIVALGDSITTGYGLTDYDANNVRENTTVRNYANLVKENKGANLVNLAHDGDKVENLIDVISDIANTQILSNADVILISIGGNELLDPLIQVITQEVMMKMSMGSDIAINDLVTALNNNSQAFSSALESYEQSLPTLLEMLTQKNSEAQIIFQTLYNPLENAKQSQLVLSLSTEEDNSDVDELYSVFDTYINQLNIITKNQIKNQNNINIVCCDTYNAFKDYIEDNNTEILTNIEGDSIINFDIHPNAKGHSVIYQSVVKIVRDKPVVRTLTSTIYIYTNGTRVNDPNVETTVIAGGSVEGSEKNEDKYDIISVYENEVKFPKVIVETGYQLSDIKLDGKSVEAKYRTEKYFELNGSEMPAVIEVYFLKEYNIVFNVGLNGKITVPSKDDNEDQVLDDSSKNITETVAYNGSITCRFEGNKGYIVNEIYVNSEKLNNANISTYTFREVKEDKTFTVTFKKIEKTEYVNDIYGIKLDASTDSVPYGTTLNVQTLSRGEEYNKIVESIDEYIANIDVYNFSLSITYVNESISIEPEGEITLSIPVPTKYDKEKLKLFYVSNGYVAEELEFTIDEEENMLNFVTDHCSYYVLIEVGTAPKSYVWLYIVLGAVMLIIIIAIVVILAIKKRNREYKKRAELNAKRDYISY